MDKTVFNSILVSVWYLDNKKWWEGIISGEYQTYYEKMYNHR